MTNPEQPDSPSLWRVLSSGMRRAKNNQILVVVASLADSIILPPIMSNATESVHHALTSHQNTVATLDLNSLRGIIDTSASKSYLSHLYNQPIGIILSEIHAISMAINFPDDTIDKHPNKMLNKLAKWHNFWHSSPTTDTPSSHVIETLRAIPKTAALLLTLSTSYTAELVLPTLLCLSSGSKIDSDVLVPGFLAMLASMVTVYDLAIITASIAQHFHPKEIPERPAAQNRPERPALPAPSRPESISVLESAKIYLGNPNNSFPALEPEESTPKLSTDKHSQKQLSEVNSDRKLLPRPKN